MSDWFLDTWCAVRVAGLPSSTLLTLTASEAAARLTTLLDKERSLGGLRECAIEDLHASLAEYGKGSSPQARTTRRTILALKRAIFNGRPLLAESDWPTVSPQAQRSLALLAAAEKDIASLTAQYADAADREWRRCEMKLRQLINRPELLHSLLLTGRSFASSAISLAALPKGSALTRRQQRALRRIGTYAFRAAYRTTPFAGLTAVGVLPVRDCLTATRRRCDPQLTAVRTLDVFRVTSLLLPALQGSVNVPLRANPFRTIRSGHPPRLRYVPVREVAHYHEPAEIECSEHIDAVLAQPPGSVEDRAADLAACWNPQLTRQLIGQLIHVGLLHPVVQQPPSGQGRFKRWLRDLANLGADSASLREADTLLEAYEQPDVQGRLCLLDRLDSILPGTGKAPFFEDVLIDPSSDPNGVRLPSRTETIRRELAPLIHLCRASSTSLPHYLLCNEFMKRFGLDGRCDDLGGFIVDMLGDQTLLAHLRRPPQPPLWLESHLLREIEDRAERIVECDPSWFSHLPQKHDPGSASAFLQFAEADDPPLMILNGVQAGRYKYLSRFLQTDLSSHARPLREIRTVFDQADPVPVELAPCLGINFQLHPALCPYSLQLPGEPDLAETTLPLSDFFLFFDQSARTLKTKCKSLGRFVEFIHLGSLRDPVLPDPLLLLRALSPRYRDDLLAERVALYNFLDARAFVAGALPRFRPRLTVGRLVLERARWALRTTCVPCRETGESAAAFLRRLTEWRHENDVPERTIGRRLSLAPSGDPTFSNPLYMDWSSPVTLNELHHVLSGENENREWLVLQEAIPLPEESPTLFGSEPRATEWMFQMSW